MGKHRIWRRLAKKARRKRIRQALAKERDAKEAEEQKRLEQSPSYIQHLKELAVIEEWEQLEQQRQSEIEHQKWLEREREAQIQWEELQKKLENARSERERQERIIREEWENEQKLIAEKKREKEALLEATQQKQKELEKQIEDFIENDGALPESLNVNFETNPTKEICPFFKKTGVCRFSDTCSRNHIKPGVSRILLINSFYTHFGMEQSNQNEYDADISLEFDDDDTYTHFTEFYSDVYPEFAKCGPIITFRVCKNFEQHLRGNVYVEFEHLQSALKAYRMFHGRWYGGKQLTVEFTSIPNWTAAICGLFFKNKCPKGRNCNFLHVFLNPGERFKKFDFNNRNNFENNISTSRTLSHCRWSESPEMEIVHHRTVKSKKRHRSRERNLHSIERSRHSTERSAHEHQKHKSKKYRNHSRSRSRSKSRSPKSRKDRRKKKR